MKKVFRFLDSNFEEIVISACMGYFVVVTILQVIFRFVLNVPAAWTEETAKYAFIWMTYVGSALATKKSTHIRVDLLDSYLKPRGKEILFWISQIFFLIFAVIVAKVGVDMLISLGTKPQTSPALKIPMQWIYLSLPVGMGLTVFRLMQNFYKKIKSYAQEKEESRQ